MSNSLKKTILIGIILLSVTILSFILGMFLLNNIDENKTEKIANSKEEIEQNEKQKVLNITQTEYEVSKYFPKNINKIILTNYLSSETEPTTYVIENYDKMKEFTKLFFTTNWTEDTTNYNEEWLESEDAKKFFNRKPEWEINFIGDTKTNFKMMNLSLENFATVVADNGTINKTYLISEKTYREILAFTNTKYYLHKSDIEIPERNKRYIAQTKAFEELEDEKKEYIKERFRYLHLNLERMLVGSSITLKDKNSPYWEPSTKKGTYQDPSGTGSSWESNGGYSKILEDIQNYANELKNETVKNDLKKACNLLKEGIDNHNLAKFFEAHEIVHDYDYWVFSIEPSFVTFEPVDWEGTHIYFGKTEVIE